MTSFPTTGNDWQLYTSEMRCGHAARSLTAALRRALKEEGPDKAYDVWRATAIKWAVFGALDSEPCGVAAGIIEKHFGIDDLWAY